MTSGALSDLERSYFDVVWHLDPVEASHAGVTEYDDRLGRFGAEALRPHLVAVKALSAALEEANVPDLETEIDRTALLNAARVTLRRLEREQPQRRNPEFWLSHLLAGLHTLAVRRNGPPAVRAHAVLGRLEDVPTFLDEARATIDDPVGVFVETAAGVCAAGEAFVRELPIAVASWAPELGGRVAEAAQAAAQALATFGEDLERWRDGASERFAIGEDAFNFRLHYEHALRDTAPELWRYGHHLVEEIEADLAARAARLGSEPWGDVVERLRADHPPADELVAAYAREMARARDFVAARSLAPLPDGPLEVVPTPEFMHPLVPFAAYDAPGAYGEDPMGRFYVTVPDARRSGAERERALREHSRHGLAATALHEGYPGHHLQLALARQQRSHTRKNLWTPLTVEGWALYCEDMMAEQGFYATEEEQLFQRVHLLWRAVRVLLDVGLHTRGMSFAEAVDMLMQRVHVERASAEAEVRRYCAWPGYQLCYAVGRRELLRLRDDFRTQQGSAFTLRRFHDAVLHYGGLPVTLMRWGLELGD